MTVFFLPGCPACDANSEKSTLATEEIHARLHELITLDHKERTTPSVLDLLNRLDRRLDTVVRVLEEIDGADEAEFLVSEALDDLEALYAALEYER